MDGDPGLRGLAYGGSRWKLAQGGLDLVIDATSQQVTLPRSMGRKADVVIPIGAITSVEVERTENWDSGGNLSHRFAPVLVVADEAGSTRREKIIEWRGEWWGQTHAEELAAWLRERLRIEPPRGDCG